MADREEIVHHMNVTMLTIEVKTAVQMATQSA